MPEAIDRDQVHKLVGAGAQLVEVLSSRQYEQVHLPGAINIPLTKLDDETARRLERHGPIIVYCYDSQ
jgi:rhodanese-related sulfurtransferase